MSHLHLPLDHGISPIPCTNFLPVNSPLSDVDSDAVGPLDVVPDDGDVEGAVHAGARNVRVSSPVGIKKKTWNKVNSIRVKTAKTCYKHIMPAREM
jgi:hypothetical protein